MKHLLLSICCLFLGLSGCSDAPIVTGNAPPADSELFLKLVNGRLTSDRPEVGLLKLPAGICTATLIAPDVIITAAHCVDYQTIDAPGNVGTFNVQNGVDFTVFPVVSVVSLGGELGANDIAVAQLSVSVPSELARPVPVAAQTPQMGTSLSVFGYGCTRRDGVSDGQKRVAHFTSGEASAVLCPGDSGGPVFENEYGAITRINSGYYLGGRGEDVYGDAVLNGARIMELVTHLSQHASDAPGAAGPNTHAPETLCGFDHSVQQDWACGAQGTTKMRCRKGYAPEFEACPGGCRMNAAGRATCTLGAQGASGPRCGDVYSEFDDWTCTTDRRTILRCREGTLDIQRCGSSCVPGTVIDPQTCGG